MLNEAEIIEKASKGDEDSFAKIIDLYKNYVFAIILNFIKDYNEVENIAQEVFLQVYLSLPTYKSNNFKAWIGRIASNKSIDWLRKKKSKYKEEVLEEESLDSFNLITTDTPEELLIKKEKEQEISRLCKSIPPIYEKTIIKFYLHGKSYEEIAREEGVTVKTVASRLYRGKSMLKEKWREENETL